MAETWSDLIEELASLTDDELAAYVSALSEEECAFVMDGYEIEQTAVRTAEAVVTVASTRPYTRDRPEDDH